MTEIDTILQDLRARTGASRVTLRQDVHGEVFPVTHEVLGDGALPIKGVVTPDMARQPVVLQVQQGKQVVQDDCRAASNEPHFRTMLELYGGLRAQIVTPIAREGRVVAIVSVHQLERTRHWTEEEIGAASRAVERIEALL